MVAAGVSLYVASSFLATTAAGYLSYYRYEQFYPTCVNMATGKINQMIVANFFLSLLVLFAVLLKKVTLGTLREMESEQLLNRFWSSMFDALLLSSIFSQEISARFYALFATQMIFLGFHWIAKSRVDYIETQQEISLFSYVRLAVLTILLTCVDMIYTSYVISLSYVYGPSFQILFGFEYCLLLWKISLVNIKFFLHVLEKMIGAQWHRKQGFLRIMELLEEALKLSTLIIFFISIQSYYGTPIHLCRRIFVAFRAFQRTLGNVQDYYRLLRSMNTLFPDATPEQLVENPMCLICREEDLVRGKVLPCGHIFHANCLYSWLVRSHECPACRFSLREHLQGRGAPPGRPQPAVVPVPIPQQPQQHQQPQVQIPQDYIPPVARYQGAGTEPPVPASVEDTIRSLEENINLLKEQMHCMNIIMQETENKLNQLKQYQNTTEVKNEPIEEEEEEENIYVTETKQEEPIPEPSPSPPLSPKEAMRRRRLMRFSSDTVL